MNEKIYQYYVEGENEKKIVNVLKSEKRCIVSGKVSVFNVTQEKLSNTKLRMLKKGTTIVLVYDTDVGKIEILQNNIQILKKQNSVDNIIYIPQVENLEDELLRACSNIKKIEQLTNSTSKKNFKTDLNQCTNLKNRLEQCGFNMGDFWNTTPQNSFNTFGNDSEKVRIQK